MCKHCYHTTCSEGKRCSRCNRYNIDSISKGDNKRNKKNHSIQDEDEDEELSVKNIEGSSSLSLPEHAASIFSMDSLSTASGGGPRANQNIMLR